MTRFKVNRCVAAARVLSGVLAGAFLLFALLAADAGFHQALHRGGRAAADSCLLCLLVKGHLDLPDLAPVRTASVQPAFDLRPWVESTVRVDFSYVVSSSRAPPALLSLPVVGA